MIALGRELMGKKRKPGQTRGSLGIKEVGEGEERLRGGERNGEAASGGGQLGGCQRESFRFSKSRLHS
jgi:hypothetical protein